MADAMRSSVPGRERALAWDGCLNVRDLGGFATDDGGETRFDRVVRADSVRKLSRAGWAAAVSYGISRVVDLRWREEREADPPAELPVEVVHVSLFGEQGSGRRAEVDRQEAAAGDDVAEKAYHYLHALEHHCRQFATAVSLVADAPAGVVLVHCEGGKDRTGLVSALLLRLAGVAAQDVAADYALSEVYLAPRHEQWLQEAADEAERAQILKWTTTPAGAMLRVLDDLERRHGSVARYLRAAGATEDVLEHARVRLRD
jgi:protein-tyrosine phosphatase